MSQRHRGEKESTPKLTQVPQSKMTPEQQLMLQAMGKKAEELSKNNWPLLMLRNDFAQQL